MNAPFTEEISRYSPLDVLLTDIAVRVQLSPTEYLTAVEHYRVMSEWIDRVDSPLHGYVDEFYPQGGFSTGSTVAGHSGKSDFDLDAMACIRWPRSIDPETALATLHRAIAGEDGSRYHDKSERMTRCTQITYDGMHLDVTPSIRLAEFGPKTSLIFHSKPSDPSVAKRSLLANPHGLATWFNGRVQSDDAFGQFFEKRSLDYDRGLPRLKADSAPVPEQLPIYRKSRQVICLQLIKRWRNVAYDRRHKSLRLPPSVLMTFFIGLHTGHRRSLTDELIYQIDAIVSRLENVAAAKQLIHEVNPTCENDILTDRWPGNLGNQQVFIYELREFARELSQLKSGLPLAEMRGVLEKLFGEKPASDAITAYVDRFRQDGLENKASYLPGTGTVPALGTLATPAIARAIPKSTPYGD
ncbi:nucleotidyltransferase [Hyphomicrobium sp. MC8b]|uniref:nucleotidyltransferase domain-containing protein n=1 Tax=Hyphomicrobium sp. MC8b TaxID=300273 RepID=UPI00391B32AE